MGFLRILGVSASLGIAPFSTFRGMRLEGRALGILIYAKATRIAQKSYWKRLLHPPLALVGTFLLISGPQKIRSKNFQEVGRCRGRVAAARCGPLRPNGSKLGCGGSFHRWENPLPSCHDEDQRERYQPDVFVLFTNDTDTACVRRMRAVLRMSLVHLKY